MAWITDIYFISDEGKGFDTLPATEILGELLKTYTVDTDYHTLRLEEDWQSSAVEKSMEYLKSISEVEDGECNPVTFSFNSKVLLDTFGLRFIELKAALNMMTWQEFLTMDAEKKIQLYSTDDPVFIYWNKGKDCQIGNLEQLMRRIPTFKDGKYVVNAVYSRHTCW
jgi:hypothetical protein